MITTIKELIEKATRIYSLINQAGFQNSIIFKGFSEDEEHNLNLLVYDIYTLESESSPQTLRRKNLEKTLTNLLLCKVIVTTDEYMKPAYQKLLDRTNSVALTIDNDNYINQLEEAFGLNWFFNSADNFNLWKTQKDLAKIKDLPSAKSYTITPIQQNSSIENDYTKQQLAKACEHIEEQLGELNICTFNT